MTDKLKCPFCGAGLKNACAQVIYFCPNDECHKAKDWYASKQVWQALIFGKKAQHQLRTVKDRCAKKIKAKEREIANYLNGINVRDKEIQNLREQLQKTQDALKVATDALSKIDAFNCHDKGAIEIMAGMVSIANGALYKITSITKQE